MSGPPRGTPGGVAAGAAELLALTLLGWCVMGATHEAGHLLGGWAGGGTPRDWWLGPWPPPHSRVAPDPHPALTLWAGPVLGCGVPVLLAALVPGRWPRWRARGWFLADFCLLANGAYLLVAWVTGDRLLDTARLLAAGVSPVRIALFAGTATAVGYVRFREDCRAVWERRGRRPGRPNHRPRR